LVQADFLVITDTSGLVIAKAGEVNIQKRTVDLKPNKYQHGYNEYYNILNDSIYQVLSAPIYFYNRFTIGKLIAGYKIDHKLIQEFTQLSGADIILLGNQKTIVQSNPNISITLIDLKSILHNLNSGKVNTYDLDEDYLILKYVLQSKQGVTMLLMKSLDELLDPVMSKISIYLVVFNVVMLLVSIFLIYSFTSRYLTDAINRLVASARKISKMNLMIPFNLNIMMNLVFLLKALMK